MRTASGTSRSRSRCVRSPTRQTWLRPRRLAAYSARSAADSSESRVRKLSPPCAAPIETVTGMRRPSTIIGVSPTPARTSSASSRRPGSWRAPVTSTASSSPPSRATSPRSPTMLVRRRPSSISTSSPAWWPCVSLMRLKRSTSSSRRPVQTAVSGRSSRASSVALSRARLASPVSASVCAWRSAAAERDLEGLGHARALGDVREDADQQQASVDVAVGEHARPDVADDAVLADHAVLGLGRLGRAHLRDVLAQRRLVVLVHGAAPAREHVRPGRCAEQPGDAGVDVERAQVAVGGQLELEEDVVDGLDEPGQPLARVAQLLGDTPALGDVEAEAVDVDGAVLGVRRVHAIEHPARAAVVADDAVLELGELLRAQPVGREELGEGRPVVGMHRRVPGVLGTLVRTQRASQQALDPGAGVGLAVAIVEPEVARVQVQVERAADLLVDLARPPQQIEETPHEEAHPDHEHDARADRGDVDDRRVRAAPGERDRGTSDECSAGSDDRDRRARPRERRGREERPGNREDADRRPARQGDARRGDGEREPVTERPLQGRGRAPLEARGGNGGEQTPHYG